MPEQPRNAAHDAANVPRVGRIEQLTTDLAGATGMGNALTKALDQLAEAQATIVALTEALVAVEWSSGTLTWPTCPDCCFTTSDGHGDNCTHAAAIARGKAAVK